MRLVRYRGSFAAYWRDETGPRRVSLRTADRGIAESRLLDLERAQRNSTASTSTIEGVVHLYLVDKEGRPGAERARHAWARLKPVFGHLRSDQVDRPLCRAYAAARRRGNAADGTIIKELSVLRAALRWHDPLTTAIIELPPAPPPKSRHLSRAQYRTLRDAARTTPHLYLFVVLAYATAGRASAVLELTWDRVDFETGRIRLGLGDKRAKGRATVPMTDSARAALAEARPAALTESVIEYAGRPVHSVKRAFAAAAVKAGVPWCTPHVLRHTAAVHMIESGVSIAEVAQYLGHSSEGVTYRVYARFSPDYLRRAASALE